MIFVWDYLIIIFDYYYYYTIHIVYVDRYETPLSQGTSGAVSPAESFVSVASGPVCDTTKCQDGL